MIAAKGLKKSFIKQGEKFLVIDSLNFQWNKKGMYCISGLSGVGKSTLLNILSGLLIPDEGHISIFDHPIDSYKEKQLTEWRRKEVGFIFQNHLLLPDFTAKENIEIALKISRNKKNFKVKEIMEKVDMWQRRNHLPGELSGGESQRIAIARAMIHRPKIIFADEPAGNLDKKNALNIGKLMKDLAKDKNCWIVCVSHSKSILDLADFSYELKKGKLE